MDARSLFAVLAIFFLLWLVRTWANWDSKEKIARKSRQRLRNRLLDSSLGERIGKSSSLSARKVADDELPAQRGLFAEERHPAALSITADPSDNMLAHDSDDMVNQSTADISNDDANAESIANSDIARLHERLERAEAKAAVSEQNDLELRRLRSELASLKTEKSSAASRIEALEKRIVEQQQILDRAKQGQDLTADVVQLRLEVAERERQNQELRARLASLTTEIDANENSHSGNQGEGTGALALQGVERDRSVGKPAETEGRTPAQQSFAPKSLNPLFQAPSHRDDLKLIKGIGPVMERTLNELGVTTFNQLASFSQADIDNVSEAIGSFPGRIERDDWVGKARQFVLEQSTV